LQLRKKIEAAGMPKDVQEKSLQELEANLRPVANSL
jgi:hypothetical protein